MSDRERRELQREAPSYPAGAMRTAVALMRHGDTAGALWAFSRVDFALVRTPSKRAERRHPWAGRTPVDGSGRWWRLQATGDGRAVVAATGERGQAWATNYRRGDSRDLYFDDLAEALDYVAERACAWRWRPQRD